MMTEMCPYYKTGKICTNNNECCEKINNTCVSNLYYSMDLEQQLQLEKDNVAELNELLIAIKEEAEKVTYCQKMEYLDKITKEINNEEKYKQALKKIEEIVKKPCIVDFDCINCTTRCIQKDILNIIKECKE